MKIAALYKNIFLVFSLASLVLLAGCKKEFLEKKPIMGNLIPKTLKEFEGLLNNYSVINKTPNFAILCADEYQFLTREIWLSSDEVIQNSYNWNHSFYEVSDDWNNGYKTLLYANTVITGLNEVVKTPANQSQYGNIKGQAYFLRAYTFFNLVQVFALPYDAGSAGSTPGIPLPLEVNPNKPLQRATLADTYAQVISDLEIAISSFSDDVSLKPTLGSKVAAHAFLARVYLSAMNYPKAMESAKASLAIKGELLDYNTLDQASPNAFDVVNPELLFNTTHGHFAVNYDFYAINYGNYGYDFKTKVNPDLISLYDPNDLRLKLFYFTRTAGDADKYIKNLYQVSTLSFAPFSGLATDEVYLILAECLARNNETEAAMDILNKIALKRFPAGFVPVFSTSDKEEALRLVLLERRKQLVYRGSRWLDVRRLNKGGANITLSRTVGEDRYTLPPNDKRYALPIPLSEISFSGIQQN